jgi:DNA modification methylase
MPGRKIELFDAAGASRGFYSDDNRLNELTGREWVYWTKSVITRPYPANMQHKLRSRHGGQKPPDLCADLIRVFSKGGETVLDPLAGVGGTLLGASIAGRSAVGVEINPEWAEVYREVCRLEGIAEQRLIVGDALSVQEDLAREGCAADLVLTDVPYWRMDKARRSRGVFKRVGEAAREPHRSRLSAFNGRDYATKEEWLEHITAILAGSARLLKPRRYLAVFIGDMYCDGSYHMLSADLASALQAAVPALRLKANLIWYDVSKSLHVYGYRYDYIPSLIHQNILVFRKEIRDEGSTPPG